jgi:TRAP transporter 4TM/12TM fusion protein
MGKEIGADQSAITEYREDAKPARFRAFKGVAAKMVTAVAVVYVLFEIIYLLGFITTDKIFLYPFAFRAAALGLVMVFTFLVVPANSKAPRDRLPWYEIPLILGSIAGCGYIFLRAPQLLDHLPWASPLEQVLGMVTIVLLLEVTRRAVGVGIVVIVICFFLHSFFCQWLPGIFSGKGYQMERVMQVMYVSQDGVFGTLLNIGLVTIFAFILFVSLLQVTGGGKFFTDVALSLTGRTRGGPAKAAVIGSSLFGMMSGSAAANAAAVGSLTIPLMKEAGFRPHIAGAVEGVASTGGQLMPPVMGAAAFVMADLLGISYAKVCIAAFIPAVLYYVSLFLMVDLEAVKAGLKGLPREQLPSLKRTMLRGWVYLPPLVVLIYYLGAAGYSAEASALRATACLFLISLLRKETRVGLKKLIATFLATTRSMIDVVITCALIGVIMGDIQITGLGLKLASGLVNLSGGSLPILLLLAAAAAYILGMGMPTTVCYVILATLVAPAIVQLGVLPIAAHLFVLYFGIVSMFTPPVCPAVYVTSALAGASMMKTGLSAMRLGIVILITPFMFIYNPVLLAIGSPFEVGWAMVTGAIGAGALAASAQGYLLKPANWFQRLLLFAASLLLIKPGLKTDACGIVLICLVALWQWLSLRRVKAVDERF